MVEDTLSPVRGRNRRKTTLKPAQRYAVDRVCADEGIDTESATLRVLVQRGLSASGWDEARIIEEYARYAASCVRDGVENEYETGR